MNPVNDDIYIVEGEKCTEVMKMMGFPAVGIPGASAWKREWRYFFRGKNVYLIPDNDDPKTANYQEDGRFLPPRENLNGGVIGAGMRLAYMIRHDLKDIVKDFRILPLLGQGGGYDIADYYVEDKVAAKKYVIDEGKPTIL